MLGIELVEFGRDDIDNIIAKLPPGSIDRLAFGAIALDAAGTVLEFNTMEGEISGCDPAAVVGKNFFRDIAPCTDTRRFRGVFDAGVAAGSLRAMIEYTFDHNMRPTKVRVHMKKSIIGDTYWIFVKRL
jgi:photoactive yellow protein